VRLVERAPPEPVLSVDGAFGARGLNLSHWPGHATPRELRHDLSTGACLRFARLAADDRARRLRGIEQVVNNHYDTDGTCALFAAARPDLALELEAELLDAAACGDFFRVPSERAFQVDALVSGLADDALSPLARELAGQGGGERHQRATDHLLERLPAILRGDLAPYRALWEPALDDLRTDRAALSRAARAERAERDLVVWTAASGAAFDPGRHALFGSSEADRALVIGRRSAGTTWRLVVNTTSWFDLVTRARLRRPDLETLAARLNALAGTSPADEHAWRAQAPDDPAPELWFGRAEIERFAEQNGALAPTHAPRERVLETILAALPIV
jgi:hypothetical protein